MCDHKHACRWCNARIDMAFQLCDPCLKVWKELMEDRLDREERFADA